MILTTKALKRELDKDSHLLAELHVAKELGMTLNQLQSNMTYAELSIWCAYFSLLNDRQDAAMKKARSSRR